MICKDTIFSINNKIFRPKVSPKNYPIHKFFDADRITHSRKPQIFRRPPSQFYFFQIMLYDYYLVYLH